MPSHNKKTKREKHYSGYGMQRKGKTFRSCLIQFKSKLFEKYTIRFMLIISERISHTNWSQFDQSLQSQNYGFAAFG